MKGAIWSLLVVACSRPYVCPPGLEVDVDHQRCADPPSDGCVLATYYRDTDRDSYGVAGQTMQACAPVVGWATQAGDCDDAMPSINPGQSEVCDGVDNNCNSQIDESLPTMNCFPDADHDGYGDSAATPETHCGCPAGSTAMALDCSDASASAHPGADWTAGTYCLPGAGPCVVGGAGSSADWNCDGTVEQRWTDLAHYTCALGMGDNPDCYGCNLAGGTCSRSGWAGPVPACGSAATWIDCVGPTCTRTTSFRGQECR